MMEDVQKSLWETVADGSRLTTPDYWYIEPFVSDGRSAKLGKRLGRRVPGYNARHFRLVLKMKAGFHSNEPAAWSFPPRKETVKDFLIPSGFKLGFHIWLFASGQWWYRWVPADGKQFWQELNTSPTNTLESGHGDFQSGKIPANKEGSNTRAIVHEYIKPTFAISDILTCIKFQQYDCEDEDYLGKFRFCKSW